MTVHFLPSPARAVAPHVATTGPRPLTYGLGSVALRLGVDHRPDRHVMEYVRLLMARAGFPAPLPRPRGTTLLTGAEAVGTHARWDRRAVDAWLDGQLPPGALAALSDAATTERDAALDDRADNLDQLLIARRHA